MSRCLGAAILLVVGCASEEDSATRSSPLVDAGSDAGGIPESGGASAGGTSAGGSSGTSGRTNGGGAVSTGGVNGSGGVSAGGISASGGVRSTGGAGGADAPDGVDCTDVATGSTPLHCAPGQICCAAGTSSVCAAACATGIPLLCDGPEDCGGRPCCFQGAGKGTVCATGAVCEAAGDPLCGTRADCPSSYLCCTRTAAGRVGVQFCASSFGSCT